MRCKSTVFFLNGKIIYCNFACMKKKLISYSGLFAVAVGIALFILHGLLFPYSNTLLLLGLFFVLAGVISHVIIAKHNSKY